MASDNISLNSASLGQGCSSLADHMLNVGRHLGLMPQYLKIYCGGCGEMVQW